MFDLAAPSALRWLIGVELARYRNEAGLSLSQLATACGIGKPKLSHLETGRSAQYPSDIRRVLSACRVPAADVERLVRLSGRSDEAAWVGPWTDVAPDWLRTMVGLESLARAEFVFEPVVVPGLLQTEAYARALTSASPRVSADATDRLVEFRMGRSRLLTEDRPLEFHAVVALQALHLAVGDREIRNEQYRHLLELHELPNVTLQVVPPEAGPHAASTGQFALLDFADARPVVYVELQDAAVFVDEARRVRTYTLGTQNLARVALPPAESAALIESLIT
ncbi:helix-turn-helix domain-containing protein [Saccharothrix australiensis]|uniref:Helix-turn-helix protein n=1 Tax=Saccharothrix australiensis TaxID=2072 RepID=A0A495VU13_9PSEU|nr:helix-turn-helix transcriptional regulator [Saccharothrix australiensis]RKT52866.1 helix-turn-helix protein [Saccharothrix australiensis]